MSKPKVKVKICGITNLADARCAWEAGVRFLGFNFYPRSPRYINPKRARSIVRRLPKNVASVGIFVNEHEADVVRIAQLVGLKYVQLHGDETPDSVPRLRRGLGAVKIIKAIRVQRAADVGKAARFKDVSSILLDGFDARGRGGTGKSFDWQLAAARNKRQRMFLAGGLTPENVAEAIAIVRPYAIDVCSGVESSPGKKDLRKIKTLMHNVNGKERPGQKEGPRR
ncbi:MAG TPA: phosphoribosylanthranilate isomerase [Candidatus Acidoferrum sp.]|nr:phosphoribosylanthranilate isomerase [Candidatus Acidoferrum sp.]